MGGEEGEEGVGVGILEDLCVRGGGGGEVDSEDKWE